MSSQASLNIEDNHSESMEDLGEKLRRQHSASRLNSIIQKNFEKKEQLGTSFSGIIKSGIFKNQTTLHVFYALKAGPSWELINGQPSGMSQKSTSSQDRIVWDFPFSVTYQTKSLQDWPQIVLVLYRTDYFGRSLVEAYGNTHLPTSNGKINKKVRIYKPLQPSSVWSCLNMVTANLFQFKEPQNYLLSGKQRNNIRTEYCGQIQLQVDLKKINFEKNGYQ